MVRQHHHRDFCLILALAAAIAGVPTGGLRADELVPFVILEGGIPDPLTGEPGDAERGMALVVNSDKGNCVICHAIPIPDVPEGAFGDVGPPLAGVADALSVPELRLRVVNPRLENAATIMPAYYRIAGLQRVADAYAGKPILTAQEVEDVVAYLTTLHQQAR